MRRNIEQAVAVAAAVLVAATVAGCGGKTSASANASGSDDDGWPADVAERCGPDPGKTVNADLALDETLGCRVDPKIASVCEANPTSQLRRRKFCYGNPPEECELARERRVEQLNLDLCHCMTDAQYASHLDYCENAP